MTEKVISLKEYVLDTFEKLADLTKDRNRALCNLLDSFNASKYTKEQFTEAFALEGVDFFSLMSILANNDYYDMFVEFGNSFNIEKNEKSLM